MGQPIPLNIFRIYYIILTRFVAPFSRSPYFSEIMP